MARLGSINQSWSESGHLILVGQEADTDYSGITYPDQSNLDLIIRHIQGDGVFVAMIQTGGEDHGFQIRNGWIEVLTVRSEDRYLQRANRYAKWLTSKSLHRWKEECSRDKFIPYAIYWLWRRSCPDVDFITFYSQCQISHGDKILIRYQVNSNWYQVDFDFDAWLNHHHDLDEWIEYCYWKQYYYRSKYQQCRLHSFPVARYSPSIHLEVKMTSSRLDWYVDRYLVHQTEVRSTERPSLLLGFRSCLESTRVEISSEDLSRDIQSSDDISTISTFQTTTHSLTSQLSTDQTSCSCQDTSSCYSSMTSSNTFC